MRFFLSLLLIVVSVCGVGQGADTSAPTPEENKEAFFSPSIPSEGQSLPYWKDFINMLVTLLFVLALVFASIWFLKRVMRSRLNQLNRSTGIKVLERRSLAPKSSLYLISILGKGVVIAESPAGIQLITELPVDLNVEEALLEKQESLPTSSFTSVLQKKMKQMIKRDADA